MKKKSQVAAHPFGISEYRRPSRRGGGGGKRELVVTSMYRESGGFRRRQTVVPFIRMSGAWLEQLGFDRGDRIEVTAEHERLVLTVVRDE
ncbi:MAG TPA: SymE family type I addiction module toxin [Thermoanaerobaculia bacterium]|nr:SymE family type I addiction module toxin [Thermoanaerobaculia bacterium]